MPFAARRLVLTYNAVASNDAGYHLHGPLKRYRDANNLRHQYQILVTANDEATFITRYLALEAAYSKDFQPFIIVHGATTTTFSEADRSGLNQSPEIERAIDEDLDGEWSRLYDVRVDLQLPRDDSDDDGLLTFETHVRIAPSGKLLAEIIGSFTAVNPNNARVQYLAEIDALAENERLELGIAVWDLDDQDFRYDRQRNIISFSRSYREMLTKDSLSVFNSTKLKNHRYAVAITELRSGDSIQATRKPIELLIFFEADVNKDEVLGTAALNDFYRDEIEPLLLEIAMDASNASRIALKRRTPNLLAEDSQINVTLEVTAYADSNFLASIIRTTIDETLGIRFVAALDGNAHSAHVLPAQGEIVRITEQQILFLNTPNPDAADDAVLNATLGSGSVLGGGGNPGSNVGGLFGGGGTAGGFGGNAGIFGVGASSPGGLLNFGGGGAGSSFARRGGALGPGQIPKFGQARGGRFIPFRQVNSSQPIYEGIEPFQVLTTQFSKTVYSFYVATPRKIIGGTGGRRRGGGGGGRDNNQRPGTRGRGGVVGDTGGSGGGTSTA